MPQELEFALEGKVIILTVLNDFKNMFVDSSSEKSRICIKRDYKYQITRFSGDINISISLIEDHLCNNIS